MRSLRVALSFLTRIPVGGHDVDGAAIGRASTVFPLVGAGLGALAMALGTIARAAWPGVPILWGLVATAGLVLTTGALHQDAVADMADGFGGGHTREDVLRIMRDSVVGAYGALALVLIVGVRAAACGALLDRSGGIGWAVAAGALSRCASTACGAWLPYARTGDGLGRSGTDHVGVPQVAGSIGLAVGISILAVGIGPTIAAAAVVALVAWRIGRRCLDRIGGMTGDTLGTVTELAELAVLLLGVAWGAGR